MSLCPCGSGAAFESCCGPILDGAKAKTAEALMRSRYTAHVVGNLAHIEKTCAPELRKKFDRAGTVDFVKNTDFIGLEIHGTEKGGEHDETGKVDFTYRTRIKSQESAQREVASFRRIAGSWHYVDSDFGPKEKPAKAEHIGRNDPCPCGSGKKHKKCCGA